MGRLTDDMTRLCGEIVALRGARQGFVKDLNRNVARMQTNFRRARREMGRKTRAERRAAINHLKKTVAGLRQEFAADLQGARRAWAGK
jgi:Zn-dependent oligopeptidase